MNICLCCYRGNPYCGGQGGYLYFLSPELARMGHSLTILVGSPEPWPMPWAEVIQVENLTKRYGATAAVDHVTFTVKTGEILGFLGPNGAGRTTTMKILTCTMPATLGRVTVDSMDVAEHSLEVRRRIGYLPESAPLYTEMNVTTRSRSPSSRLTPADAHLSGPGP